MSRFSLRRGAKSDSRPGPDLAVTILADRGDGLVLEPETVGAASAVAASQRLQFFENRVPIQPKSPKRRLDWVLIVTQLTDSQVSSLWIDVWNHQVW